LTQVIATKQKKLLPKPIVTPHIVTTANKNNIVAIQRITINITLLQEYFTVIIYLFSSGVITMLRSIHAYSTSPQCLDTGHPHVGPPLPCIGAPAQQAQSSSSLASSPATGIA
jgi:hypothetical protein